MRKSWAQLKDDVEFYRNLNTTLVLKMDEQNKRLNLLEKFVLGSPTVTIACEKIVEAATQLTCSANTMIKEAKLDAQR